MTEESCTFATVPAVDSLCSERAEWMIYYTHGSGAYEAGLFRCVAHLPVTIAWIVDHPSGYPFYRLVRVLRIEHERTALPEMSVSNG